MNDLSLTSFECDLLRRCLYLAAIDDVFIFSKEEASLFVPLIRKLSRIYKIQSNEV